MFLDNRLSPDESNEATERSPLRSKPTPTRRILVVLHQEQSTAGRIGRLLRERGYALDVRRPRFGDALPTTTRIGSAGRSSGSAGR